MMPHQSDNGPATSPDSLLLELDSLLALLAVLALLDELELLELGLEELLEDGELDEVEEPEELDELLEPELAVEPLELLEDGELSELPELLLLLSLDWLDDEDAELAVLLDELLSVLSLLGLEELELLEAEELLGVLLLLLDAVDELLRLLELLPELLEAVLLLEELLAEDGLDELELLGVGGPKSRLKSKLKSPGIPSYPLISPRLISSASAMRRISALIFSSRSVSGGAISNSTTGQIASSCAQVGFLPRPSIHSRASQSARSRIVAEPLKAGSRYSLSTHAAMSTVRSYEALLLLLLEELDTISLRGCHQNSATV